jgi:hypothetical protein
MMEWLQEKTKQGEAFVGGTNFHGDRNEKGLCLKQA